MQGRLLVVAVLNDDQRWSQSHRMILALVVTVSNRPYAKKQKVPQDQFITNA